MHQIIRNMKRKGRIYKYRNLYYLNRLMDIPGNDGKINAS